MEAVETGAVLIDIRPEAQRRAEGGIPGAVIVERNVLEWRFDPASAARLPIASYELQPIVFCSEGYTSSLAAAALQELGLLLATDLEGGFGAWRAASLPVLPPDPIGRGQASCSREDDQHGHGEHGHAEHGYRNGGPAGGNGTEHGSDGCTPVPVS